MTKIPPDDILESLYNMRKHESDQLKSVLELYEMEIHPKISKPDFQKLKTMVKRSIHQKLRLRKFDARNEMVETGAVVTSSRGFSGIERKKRGLLSVESERAVFERRPLRITVVRNRDKKPLHPLSHQHQEVELRREKGTSEAGVRLGRPIDSCAETS